MAYDAASIETATRAPKARNVIRTACTCAECGSDFMGARGAQFCGDKHKNDWHNRSSKRGRVAMPILLAMVTERRGKSEMGTWARTELYALADQWAREDRDAGRKASADYLTPKMESGWRACDL